MTFALLREVGHPPPPPLHPTFLGYSRSNSQRSAEHERRVAYCSRCFAALPKLGVSPYPYCWMSDILIRIRPPHVQRRISVGQNATSVSAISHIRLPCSQRPLFPSYRPVVARISASDQRLQLSYPSHGQTRLSGQRKGHKVRGRPELSAKSGWVAAYNILT
jgi:hypothetical protein